jgi:hypothetical protein
MDILSILISTPTVMPNREPKLRKNTHLITIDGETKSIHAWSKEAGVPVPTIVKRLQRDWGSMEAVFCPTEDDEFCLARKTICAHANKTRKEHSDDGMTEATFNSWAAILRRTGNEHMIYQQAISIARETGQLPEGL